ncbi:hypothetical protein LOK46_13370 [Methylobacterium sp. NMS14P]|uniref:hypothetical protein n=1 Tax=Methylobacterium sp. NMS14P TaxID=2894310 RepID=UPI0023588533|nr:hypothetical protein [Methylobacterium sp. NMS14P]WCS27764.1 hypothetical protein LOK46_13370 [Methylobacterium sp. NMS14P]
MDPTHTADEDGSKRVTSALFSDAATFGSSCLRRARAEAEEYNETIREMLKERPTASDGTLRALYGIVLLPVTAIKKIEHEIEVKGKPTEIATAFSIYATGLEKRPNHADVMTNRSSRISRSKANRAAKNLLKAVSSGFVSTQDFSKEVDLLQWSRSEIEKRNAANGTAQPIDK